MPISLLSEEEAIRDRLKERHLALASHDRPAMEKLLHDQYFYVIDNGSAYNKETFLNGCFNQSMSYDAAGPQNIGITIDGIIATVSFMLEGDYEIRKGSLSRGKFASFHTLAKIDGAWIFLSGHTERV
jgi:hypothetical protein